MAVGESVSCESEEEVFWALGLDYRLPAERNCLDASAPQGGAGAGAGAGLGAGAAHAAAPKHQVHT